MFEQLRNFFMYSGVDPKGYERVKVAILQANRNMTVILSSFATVLIAGMLLLSFRSIAVCQNKVVYLGGFILSIVILFLASTVAKRHLEITNALVYFAASIYYLYGILIGTVTDPHQKTVTFMVLLVLIPTLYIDKPIRIITLSIGYIFMFIMLCLSIKHGNVLVNDISDAIVFGIFGVASGTVINNLKVRSYVLENKLKEISRIDQLTQVKNRNAYELEYDSIPLKCKNSLGCVYIDANSLHEINNTKGHEFGDKMLKCITQEVKKSFSDEYVYRTGGDEFVIFIPDAPREAIRQSLNVVIKNVEKEGYSIATGFAVEPVRGIFLDELIKSAESKMFRNKKNYYKGIRNRDARNTN